MIDHRDSSQEGRTRSTSTDEDEDDVKAIGSFDIHIDEASSPSIAAPASTSAAPPSASLAPPKSANSKVTMSSLRSLLGVPAAAGSSGGGGTSAGSLLGVPPSTSALTAPAGVGGASGARIVPNRGLQASSGDDEGGRALLQSEIAPKRKKVVLEPGCSALDWAHKKQQIAVERMQRYGGGAMQRITKAQLKQHNTKEDAWSSFNGKVYDLTPYLRFHPGGQQELLRVAGRDGTRLFMLTHSWVNIDSMIDACCIGILVSD